ncbi:MAG: hypothetical protein JJU05_05830 [Verrucomicrobia bacterium]|nr:hypothetical protein [Verrucomicrobiota bacterium]MCH8525659.1 hypothetical protein [Kiritimatiellia bacterium]
MTLGHSGKNGFFFVAKQKPLLDDAAGDVNKVTTGLWQNPQSTFQGIQLGGAVMD